MKIFYGWRMVFAGGAIQFLQNGLLHQAFGAYFAVLIEEKGWSKTSLSGAAALQPIEAAVLGPVLGWIVDRFGPQGMIRTGIIIFGIGFMLFSQIDTLAGFYAAFIAIAFGSSLCGFFPLQVAIIYWFEKRRARALSLLSLGAALGGIFVLVVAWSIQSFGWRATAFASGMLVILAGWPLARVIRGRPEDYGETIDGLPPAATRLADSKVSAQREFSTREALRTSAFWLISLGHSFALLIVYAVLVHAITHMRESLDYSVSQGSLVITLLTTTQVTGIVLGWLIGDRVEKRLLAAGAMLMHAVGLLMLTYASGPVMLGAFVVLHGIAWGLRGPLMQAIRADYFGRRSIGMIMGLSSVIIVTGQIGGPMLAAMLADWTGNYRVGFTVLAVMAGLGSLLFLLAKPPR
ncbi:MAG: MFS transporter [Pseudomonadota bacterium]